MIAQHYQQTSPIEDLANQLMKQGIATTKLDAQKMAENMLNKHMNEPSTQNEKPVQKPIVEQRIHNYTPQSPQVIQHSTASQPTIHPHIQQHITQIHSRIDAQHKIIDELKNEINALKTRVSAHDEKFHEEVGSEMATEIVEEPINYDNEHDEEEKQDNVKADIADEILQVETKTPKDEAEYAEAEEELTIIQERKKDDMDLLNIF